MESTQQSSNDTVIKPIKVLIADDDPPTRLLLKAGIVRWGYPVTEASDGEQAWDLIQKEDPPDIIILDWMMPKLDGVSLCLRIQEQLNFKPYIILLTQMSGTQNIIKGLEAGADEYLSKPFNMAELRSRLSVGAKLINNKNHLKSYIARVDELIIRISDITSEISTAIHEINKTETNQNSQACNESLKRIDSLNEQLQDSLKTLKDFNTVVSNNAKSPLK